MFIFQEMGFQTITPALSRRVYRRHTEEIGCIRAENGVSFHWDSSTVGEKERLGTCPETPLFGHYQAKTR